MQSGTIIRALSPHQNSISVIFRCGEVAVVTAALDGTLRSFDHQVHFVLYCVALSLFLTLW
jgi:hypothetical protein